MAHQYMPKIFHEPHKNPPAPRPTYLMYGPLQGSKYTFNLLWCWYSFLKLFVYLDY